ncbi:ester cyclase [Streptomyces sp. NRRL B-24484]|uniref:ester cyclase n=1 Tax=Streptomyces sp. NRRL B-24484 TaxID=1463833 RepID=UPI0004C1634B|nr:ester cyclase [Streptomyces sp. NRRL B-24484]
MTFVQLIECRTDKVDDLNRLMDNWIEQTRGRRTATHSMVGADRSDARHVVEIVEFPSYEEAMRNSKLPETDRIFHEMVALCDEPPTFTDLDIVRDEQLNKAAVQQLMQRMSAGDLSVFDEVVAEDYHDHDIADDADAMGREAIRAKCAGYLEAFDIAFTIDHQMADGDRVATMWRFSGLHKGDFMGLPATHKRVEMTGMTVFRFREGMICEGWWNWDNMAMMRQLGLLRM